MNKQAKQLFTRNIQPLKVKQAIILGNETTDMLEEAYEMMITIERTYKKLIMYVIPGLNYNVLLGTNAARLFEIQLNFIQRPIKPVYSISSTVEKDLYEINLHEADQRKMRDLMKKFEQILATKYDPIGITSAIMQDIDTGDAHPIRQQPYRQSPEQKKILENEIKE